MPRRKSISFVKPQVIQVIGGGGEAMAMPEAVVIDSLSATLNVFNSNPYLIGIFYLFLNLGGRFLSLELTKRQESNLSQPYVRPFILFAVMFISTRNVAVAFWTTVGILSVLWVFANENSDFCLIPSWKQNAIPPSNNYDEIMNRVKNLMKSDDIHDDGHQDKPEPPPELHPHNKQETQPGKQEAPPDKDEVPPIDSHEIQHNDKNDDHHDKYEAQLDTPQPKN